MNDASRRAFYIALCVAAIYLSMAFAPAHAVTFGYVPSAYQVSKGLSADYKRGSKVTLTQAGVLNDLRAYMDGNGGPQTGYQDVSMVIYLDDNGVPGVKVAESKSRRINALSPQGWIDFPTAAVPLQPGTYWLVIHSGGTSGGSTPGIARDYFDPSPANWYGNADSFADGASSPFGSGSAGTGTLGVLGDYMPANQLKAAGRVSIAATPSKGLSSDFKRGARLTLTDQGRLYGLTAYLDGQGGASGTQKARLVLYRDSGGVPGERLAVSNEISIAAGKAAGWVTAEANSATLSPGSYWIMIHSGGTAGIIRDYGDGAANWYGNADNYADGPSSPFGAGSAGTGTISAAAIYIPGAVVTQTLGRTTVATIPSKGLTANYLRGGEFGAYSLDPNAVATAFWAYVDGKGGASGSQQLRIALYWDDLYKDDAGELLAESEVVTIPAGTAPGWVRFPVTAPFWFQQSPAYWITLHSGDTAGVVRDYGDGNPNWVGMPDTFADGAFHIFDWYYKGQQGTGTISMYVEYAVPGATSP